MIKIVNYYYSFKTFQYSARIEVYELVVTRNRQKQLQLK